MLGWFCGLVFLWPPSWVVLWLGGFVVGWFGSFVVGWLGGLVVGWSADYSSVSQVQPYAGEETVLEF